MEYVSYILITIGILLACFLLLRPPSIRVKKNSSETVPEKQASATDPDLEAQRARQQFQRELKHIPTPWGWPGHHGPLATGSNRPLNSEEVHGVSESLHHFVGRLFTEKRTVDSREYLLRKDANLRFLVEDRYGRASTLTVQPSRKPERHRLPETEKPDGRMKDNPGDGLEKAYANLKRQPKELRTPWGW